MFPVMNSASKINGILFCVMLIGMFLYSLPAVFGFAGTQTQAMSLFLDGKLVRRLEQFYDKNLFLRDPSVKLWANIQHTIFREGTSGVVLGRDGWLFTNQEYLVPNNLLRNLDKQLAQISKVQEQLAQQGKRLILLPIPMKLDTYAQHSAYAPTEQITGLYERFSEALRERGIATVNLRSAYLTAAADEQLFLRNDTHWSPKGAELAAQTLALQFPELRADTAYVTRAVSEKAVEGDLLNYLKFDPRLDPSYFKPVHINLYETLKQNQPLAADSLFGDESLSLALVGTSYTRIDDWNFIGFLKQALQRDLISVALEARGPFQSMDEFLATSAAASSDLQTIIWEFPLRTLLAQRQMPSALATPTTAQH
ncbi:alginate O-acetyltransferase [Pseudomonas anguilliseptica]|uniref:Probable alginate O-acetylase AlgJ n=1 Tax=Pseudomonas anguilliseptica TaxID=53406 RepID=A0A1H4X7Y8_PSEAG|nr:alginate O-acetyltransferase [Pseudomonas anguilliseptica]SED00834.1 alginate O-acetyltransferase complex protein AlgJ [Pseudomonas anguilliseptica]